MDTYVAEFVGGPCDGKITSVPWPVKNVINAMFPILDRHGDTGNKIIADYCIRRDPTTGKPITGKSGFYRYVYKGDI